MVRFNHLIYWLVALLVLAGWGTAMHLMEWWGMLRELWPISLTMVFGSFVAGATAEGGGAIAFPVFTKLFGIASEDAKIFAFMIQSFGMTMAGLVIWLRRIPVLWNVLALALLSGVVGLLIGEHLPAMPEPFPKLIFTTLAAVFGTFLIYNRWWVNALPYKRVLLNRPAHVNMIILTGLLGGLASSVVGVGLDMLIFIVLTLYFAVDEKISTPTTVVMMGLLSVVGFFWHGVVEGSIHGDLWRYWMSAVPVVIFGAPLGAWVCSKITRDQLIYVLLVLILIEVATSAWLIRVGWHGWLLIGVLVVLSSIACHRMVTHRT